MATLSATLEQNRKDSLVWCWWASPALDVVLTHTAGSFSCLVTYNHEILGASSNKHWFSSRACGWANLIILLEQGSSSEHAFLIVMVDVQVYVLNHINASCFCHILSDQISLAETSQVILSKVKGEEVYSSHESVRERVTHSENNWIYPDTPDSMNSCCTPTPCISEMLIGDALWGRRRKGGNGPSLSLSQRGQDHLSVDILFSVSLQLLNTLLLLRKWTFHISS